MESMPNSDVKKWSRYFFDFILLFVAVSLGFIVDNLREEAGLRDREQQYLRLLTQDLTADSAQCEELILSFVRKTHGLDSLLESFDLSTANSFSAAGPELMHRHLTGIPDFVPANGTLQQLKSAGGFITIQDQQTVKRILEFDAVVQLELMHQSAMNTYYLDKMWESKAQHVDMRELKDRFERKLRSGRPVILYNDRNTHIRFSNDIIHYRTMVVIQHRLLESVRTSAVSLLKYLRERYPV